MSPHTDMTFVFHGGRSADARVSLSCMPHYPVLSLPLHDPLHALALLQSLRLLCSTKMSTSTRGGGGGREGDGEREWEREGREEERERAGNRKANIQTGQVWKERVEREGRKKGKEQRGEREGRKYL